MSKNSSVSFSFPFLSILSLIFITLKLIGIIDWTWWWVLSPLWMPSALIVFGFAVFFLVSIFKTKKDKK